MSFHEPVNERAVRAVALLSITLAFLVVVSLAAT